MPKFRKRPVAIEAIQWTGENLFEVISFTDSKPDLSNGETAGRWEVYCDLVAKDGFKIKTLEGYMSATIGDWIIRGVAGEFYPCKPDIFEATYEPIERD